MRVPPAAAALLLAPFFGECLSTATPPLDLLLPWNLALMAALYGAGALLCREVARRCGLGLPGLCLLGAAYGVYEEGLVDRLWYDPGYADRVGVGAYSRLQGVNVLLASHLTVFHAAVSICCTVVAVERLYPAYRDRPWAGRPALVLAGAAMTLVLPVTWEEFPRPGGGQLVVAALLVVALVAGALSVRRRRRRPAGPVRGPARRLGSVACLCTGAHFLLVYAAPSLGVPWPVGVGLALAPVAAGVLLVRRRATGGTAGADAARVAGGVLAFFAALDLVVGLGGRYDLSAFGLALLVVLAVRRRRADRRPRLLPAAAP